MQLQAVLSELEQGGSAQTRKTYARHGVPGPMFGVSYAILKALAKKIKINHALAVELWATGNHDARVLATMIADPKQVDAKLVETWARDLSNHVLIDAVGRLAGQAALDRKTIDKWAQSKDEWTGQLGWTLVACLAANGDRAGADDAYLLEKLARIERGIHTAPNRVRYTMNGALIAIGGYCATLRKDALAAAKRIGKVEVDHGDTDCKTPDAATYIEKIVARQREKKPKARA